MVVIGNESIHVELIWNTSGAPEVDDGPCGADLDLHLLHPFEDPQWIDWEGPSKGWFTTPWDCFRANPTPDWGDPGSEDDPELIPSSGGCGGEAFFLKWPEELPYRVAVHVWDDLGFGVTNTTIRVYIYGALVFEYTDVELAHDDFWEVCTVSWPTGKIHFLENDSGGPLIYPAPGP